MDQKKSLTISWTLGFHLLSAYLITAILNFLMYPDLNVLVNLDNQVSIFSYLSLLVLVFSLLLAGDFHFSREELRGEFFTVVLVIFSLFFTWQSSTLVIVMGTFFLLMTYYSYLFFNRLKKQSIVLGGAFILVIRFIYLAVFMNEETFMINSPLMDKNLLLLFILSVILAYFFNRGSLLERLNLRIKPGSLWAIFFLSIMLYASTVGLWVIARVLVYASPTYDMGIFSQMFESMANGMGPITTLERGERLSHFAVHLSPIHYLILPIYWLLPSPLTIQALQVLIVMSGVIPLYLVLSQLKWNVKYRIVFLLLYLWMPSLTSGQFYDYHENCFLAPLVLWLIYANLSQSRWNMAVATILLLSVKEDAIVYVISIGGFFLIQNLWPQTAKVKKEILGLQIIMPIVYFLFAIIWLRHFGTGAMTSRFANFMLADQEGLIHAAFNAIKNPAFSLASIFTYEKLKYLLIIFASQAFLPLMQVSWRPYILLLPLLIINLVSNWPYQVDLFKQYHFGSSTLILFMSILTIEHWQRKKEYPFRTQKFSFEQLSRFFITLSILASLSFFITLMSPRKYDYRSYQDNTEFYQSVQKTLDKVPKNSRVVTVSSYTTPLSKIAELYDLFYHNNREVDPTIDYVVFNRPVLEGQSEEKRVIEKYLASGYIESDLSSMDVIILEAK
ncbi:DUF2079 domain-containing protein [Facklamia sp. 7083-14-GEN3]|uniref:DUF2079 domain-containing protein n=1 Tax=Facklamia sp. 7083-14-GEN3 TaxID=2973478 RepID=UPI00215BCE34|nr:DUF2079 domain-containing protein [Facklamia sp. 7083-14-GEN3]MCR8969454.1 DUF2079 domain-containing protein [Facklamia sp. 7083-14-GEN3]